MTISEKWRKLTRRKVLHPTALGRQVMENEFRRTAAIFRNTGKRWDREHMAVLSHLRWSKK